MTTTGAGAEVELAWVSWSSGKDSTLALHAVRAAGDVEVVGLVTTVNSTA
jgi:diphthamide synthase (EF-2-diphthine--ammonia ligase)